VKEPPYRVVAAAEEGERTASWEELRYAAEALTSVERESDPREKPLVPLSREEAVMAAQPRARKVIVTLFMFFMAASLLPGRARGSTTQFKTSVKPCRVPRQAHAPWHMAPSADSDTPQ